MCGRFVADIPASELKKIFARIEAMNIGPRYNVAPSQQVAVVRNAGDHDELVPMKWGLIPSWAKDDKIANHTINARSETVAEKPAFRHAIKKNRCIVPVRGFYEWSHSGTEKHPHFIFMADKSVMTLAGIWEHWNAPDGSVLETFSILTTSANKLILSLHDRMPVILQPKDYDLWLGRNMQDAHCLEHLYTPFHDDLLDYYQVPDLVNNPRFDSPACIARV